jgi:hypothetical protein
MYTVRCTRKVLEALQLVGADHDPTPTTALGAWYADFIHMRRYRLVHFVSERSLLSVVVPVKTLKTALDRHILALGNLLATMGVESNIIQHELEEMDQRVVAESQSPNLLASMGDLSLNARRILERTPSRSPEQLSLELSVVACRPLGMKTPAEVATGLLAERYSTRA